MRPSPLLVLVASLPLATGCHLGGKSAGLQADATPRKKEVWNAPRFGRGSDERRARNDASLDKAHAAARDGRHVEARLLYARVLEEDPRSAGAHHGLAILADRQQDFVKAETHYLAALELRPEDADLLNDVGYSYLLQNRHSEAKQLFVKALEVDPGHELATSNLGHLHAKNGRFEEALALFRRVGTEDQAQAEVARYTRRQPATKPREEFAEWAAEPSPATLPRDPDNLRGLSFQEMQAVRERARLASVQARRDRARQDERPFDDVSPNRRSEPLVAAESREAPPFEPGFGDEAGDPSGGRTDSGVQPIGFESIDPTPLDIAAPEPPATPYDRTSAAEFGSTATLPDTAPAFGAPTAEFWPPENSPSANSYSSAGPASAAPPWPGTNGQRMGDRMTTGVEPRTPPAGTEAGPVIRPNPIRHRAAILGMNAGSGLPIPIESSGRHTTNRRAFEPAAPTRPAFAPEQRPPAGRRPTPSDGFGAPNVPEQWPTSSNQPSQPVPTTAMVPSDASLYRSATGAPFAADDRTAAHFSPAERHGRIEDWPGLRRELNDAEGTYRSERAQLGGNAAPHPGFPSDFGPPTTRPRPRPTGNDAPTSW